MSSKGGDSPGQNNCGDQLAELEQATKQLEQGHTELLEAVLNTTGSKQERIDILQTVQDINALHRHGHPSLPEIDFVNETDWPDSWGRDLEIIRKREGQKEEVLFVETDYDDKNDRRIQIHHPWK